MDLSQFVALTEYHIRRVFQDNAVPGRIVQGRQSARTLSWDIELHDTSRSIVTKVLGLQDALSVALGTPRVRVGIISGRLAVEVPSPVSIPLLAHDAPQQKGNGLVATLGRDTRNRWVQWNLALVPHLLVTGSTGCGKSEALRTIAYSLARTHPPRELSFVLIDLKGAQALSSASSLAHCAFPVADTPADALAALQWAYDVLAKRQEMGTTAPHILLIIDEVFLVVNDCPGADNILGKIAATARSGGMSILAACQVTNKDALGNSLVAKNIPARLSGQVSDSNASYWALGMRNAGAETLLGRGDMLFRVGNDVTRLQIALTHDSDFAGLPQMENKRQLPALHVSATGNGKAIPQEWIEYFKDGGSMYQALKPEEEGGLGIPSQHTAYKAKYLAGGDVPARYRPNGRNN